MKSKRFIAIGVAAVAVLAVVVLLWINANSPMTMAEYESIMVGTLEQDLIDTLGRPANVIEQGPNRRTLWYRLRTRPLMGSSCAFDIVDGRVTSKSWMD